MDTLLKKIMKVDNWFWIVQTKQKSIRKVHRALQVN